MIGKRFYRDTARFRPVKQNRVECILKKSSPRRSVSMYIWRGYHSLLSQLVIQRLQILYCSAPTRLDESLLFDAPLAPARLD